MPTQQTIYLASEVGTPFKELQEVAEACQYQIDNHFEPIWGLSCSLIALESPSIIPSGAWHILIKNEIDVANANGYHWAENGIPYAHVVARQGYEKTVSHELLEMLVNPYAKKTVKAKVFGGDEEVDYLVEVADVSYSEHGYYVTIKSGKSIKVSDFYYPEFFYGTGLSKNAKYSYTGIVTAPRTLVDGGYISYINALGEIFTASKTKAGLSIKKLGENVKSNWAWYVVIIGIITLSITFLVRIKWQKN